MKDSRKVVDIQVIGAQISYRRSYRWAFSESVGPVVLLVRLEDAAGIQGWGELPISFHPTIPGDAVARMVQSLAGRLVVGALPRPRRFLTDATSMTGWMWFPHMAAAILCGIELALWDLVARQHEVHVCELFGGRVREAMECMWCVVGDTPEAMADATRTGAERGFRAYYVKWYGDGAEMLRKLSAVREALPDGGLLRIDPNESWTRASATGYLRTLEGWPIEFVEQPLPRFDRRGIAELRQRTSIAVCSDQGTRLVEEVLDAIANGTMDLMTVAPGDAGGLAGALDICAVAKAAGIPVSMHSYNELGVGLAALVTVACLAENCSYASQTEYLQLDWDVSRGLEFDGPYLAPDWTQPGWGIEIDLDAVARARKNYAEGDVTQSLLDLPDHERHFFPGY